MQRELQKVACYTEMEWDRISYLPANVLDYILSRLPLRDAVRTSLLSQIWRYKWATIPDVVFDTQCVLVSPQDHDPTTFKNKLVNAVDSVLLLHTASIYKFKLSHRDLSGVSEIDRWILYLSRGATREFVLEVWKGQRYKMPSCLFSFQNLTHLELFNCSLKPPPTFRGFMNLTSLDIQHITMAQDPFENLITHCPQLERLTLMNFDGFNELKLNAPNLRFFDVGGVFTDVTFINTNHLSIISIGLYANVEDDPTYVSSKFLGFFTNLPRIQKLEVQSYFLRYLAAGSVPERLANPCVDLTYLSLRINFNDLKENMAALCILLSSPNLQELELLVRPEEQAVVGSIINYWEQEHTNVLFAKLQNVRVVGISGAKTELDFIKYLLLGSPVLEKMTVKPASSGGFELAKALLRLRRASMLAEIIYLDP